MSDATRKYQPIGGLSRDFCESTRAIGGPVPALSPINGFSMQRKCGPPSSSRPSRGSRTGRASTSCKSSRPSIVPPLPEPFQFGFKERRPLAPIPMLRMLLNRKSTGILELLDDGRLRWAFDIRAADSKRREVRVLWQSVLQYMQFFPKPDERLEKSPDAEFQEIIPLILPKGSIPDEKNPSGLPELSLTTAEVAKSFACQCNHVLKLVDEKSLCAASNRTRGAAQWITRASVIRFLKDRRIS